ncbi:cyclin-domain-containing protein [Aspergillus granulosus]|uniref:Cyclin-domain-containing protein n=1 Tax=Aspergillus granulosus TaxID=176169 RepID=A0ABR4H8R4_9EURO
MEIRTRRIIRRYVSSDRARTCKRPRVYDHGEYYYRRYDQRRQSEKSHSPSYRIIETREPLKPRRGLNALWRRDSSPIRSQPFKMRLPFIKRVVEPVKDDYEPITRGRTRSPRLFVVDPPEIRYAWPRGERARSFSPEIRCISPRRRPSPRPTQRQSTMVVEEPQREARTRERLNVPRPPRERTPVVERKPMRRRRQGDVEIHQSPERRRERSGSSGRRQVRFADDIEYVEQRRRSRSRERYEPDHLGSEDDGIAERIRLRVLNRREPEIIYNRPRYRDPSPERPAYQISSPPLLPRETSIRPSPMSGRTRLRPRIIQDGESEISEAGDRIYAEALRRRSQVHDLISNSSSRWRRRFDNMRDFSSEDESYLRGSGGNASNVDSTDVFEMTPDTALGLLCAAMDKLAANSSTQGVRSGIQSGEDTPTRVTELHFSPTSEGHLGHDSIQQSVLSKRFLSKREPTITLREYLTRLHRYCPMSTGVYLATSLYITRMANVDRIISVNRKNIHRLVLAGLRVAMKTLEDLSYSHHRVAKVGGVEEKELSRLEISFCFLADFELRVDREMLIEQARFLQEL